MYARSIEDVEPLRHFLANQGIEALTKAYEIERVRSVDRGLTKIFWLVAVVGIAGCLATLAASFASSVERKRKDLGIMPGCFHWDIRFCRCIRRLFCNFQGDKPDLWRELVSAGQNVHSGTQAFRFRPSRYAEYRFDFFAICRVASYPHRSGGRLKG
jgi:hypothetical protein